MSFCSTSTLLLLSYDCSVYKCTHNWKNVVWWKGKKTWKIWLNGFWEEGNLLLLILRFPGHKNNAKLLNMLQKHCGNKNILNINKCKSLPSMLVLSPQNSFVSHHSWFTFYICIYIDTHIHILSKIWLGDLYLPLTHYCISCKNKKWLRLIIVMLISLFVSITMIIMEDFIVNVHGSSFRKYNCENWPKK